jgi:hypothetical protein
MSAPISRVDFESAKAQTATGLAGKEPNMLIRGCDYHQGFQQIAFVDTETRKLSKL